LPKEDREVADWMETLLEAEGIRVLRSSQATRVSTRDGKVQFDLIRTPRGAYERKVTQVVADTLLVSAGRVPNVEKLNLECPAPRLFVGTGQVQGRIISWELARGIRGNLTRGGEL